MNKGAVIHVNRDGRVIANFVVTESISGGGKSQAVKARSNDDRDVFMKRFLSPIYPREAPVDDRKFEKRLEGCQRFEERHREIMDRLSKPIVYGGNLVKPLHFFREKFNYYKVYPFVDSESSRAMAREEPQAQELFAKTFLASLRELHARDIVHGDLKPDNVLVQRMGAGPVAKLIDFDEAFLSGQPPQRLVGGDPVYYSPEMATYLSQQVGAGSSTTPVDPGELDTSADMFAVGLVLHEVIAGHPPEVSGGAGESHAEIVAHGGKVEMKPLRGFPREFNNALQQVVALDPADRPTVDELLGTLGVRAEPARRTPTPHDSVSIISNVEIKSSMGTRRNRNAARTRTEPGR